MYGPTIVQPYPGENGNVPPPFTGPPPAQVQPYAQPTPPVEKPDRVRCQTVTLVILLALLVVITITSAAANWARVDCSPREDKFYFKEYKDKDGETTTYKDDLETLESLGYKDHVCYKMLEDFQSAGDGALATYWTVWVGTIICGVLFTINLVQNGEKKAMRLATTIAFFVSILLFFLPVTTWLSALPTKSDVTDCYQANGCTSGGIFYKLEAGGSSCYVGCVFCLIAGIVSFNDNKKFRAAVQAQV
jgi:uncharacterized integral membrane protein